MKVLGTITRVRAGTVGKGANIGQPWQQLTIEGIQVFVPVEMQNGHERGQRVRAEVVHQGDDKVTSADGQNVYVPKYELLNIEHVVIAD